MKKMHRLNWKPDLPDFRDHLYAIAAPTKLPKKVDLRPYCSPIVNQGKIGSCTGNALAGALEYLELRELKGKAGPEVFNPKQFAPLSRLYIYYNERALEGTVDQDAGARIQDGVKVLNQFGICRESVWKYQSSLVFKKPSAAAYKEAAAHTIAEYLRLTTLAQVKTCLAESYPVVFGFTVYESFESAATARTGIMPMPRDSERVLGGHAVLAVGYNDDAQALIVRNSWGTEWGMQGYFVMPYAYIESARLAQDFWTIRK